MAEIPDVNPLEIIEIDWGNPIRDRTLQRYDDETERDNLVPFPASGDFAWIADIQEIQVYDGTGWVTVTDTSITEDLDMNGFGIISVGSINGVGNILTIAAQDMEARRVVSIQTLNFAAWHHRNIYISDTAPTGITGDIWFDTSD